MRSSLSAIDQLLMCMSKPQPVEGFPTDVPSIVKSEPYSISSSESSRASCDDNDIIAFGPIKVKPRKKPAPTLATGRRSKYETLTPDEEQKRHVRRARNRAAAERVRLSRLSIEQQLLDQIKALERQENQLSQDVQTLNHQKLHLEARLSTHQQICSNLSSSTTSQADLTSYLQFDNIFPSFQETDSTINVKLSDIDFDDLFLDTITPEQMKQALPNPLELSDDLSDFWMIS